MHVHARVEGGVRRKPSPGASRRGLVRQYWTHNIGKCAGSQIGTTRKTIIAPHFVSGHWCCATADLASRRLVYYDPFYAGPGRTGALNALGAYAAQVPNGQGANVAAGATTFERKVHNTPKTR